MKHSVGRGGNILGHSGNDNVWSSFSRKAQVSLLSSRV